MTAPVTETCSERIPLAQFSHAKLKVNKDGTACKPPVFTHFRSSETTKDSRKRNKQYLVATTDEKMEYVGQNFGPTASRSDSMCKYMVGVVDKKTNKIKVYDAQIYHLQPWIFLKESLKEDAQDVPDKKDLSFIEKNDMLTEAFGSARKQRAMESRHRNKVASEALEHSLKKAMEEAGSLPNTPTKSQEASETLDILPKCNKDAIRPEEVYLLKDIISQSIMFSLKNASEFLTSATQKEIAEWKGKEKYSAYVLTQAQALTGTGEKRKENGARLLYLMYLIHMHCLKPFQCRKGIPFISGTPDAVRTHLLNEFTVESISPDSQKTLRNLSGKMRDKLALYIILIALHIENFRVNLSQLQKELHLGSNKMQTLVRSLGCKIVKLTVGKGGTSTNQLMAQLSIPLIFPSAFKAKPKFGGRR
ncbi:DNA-directed RNA polymerase I subunit RPA49-like [Antedon mediterranea]|uniref:DNA-directed RNA polymerase I subunit RPA49-like n=1 Tax=Antedon mediterranea TaxID=105859 RepID=UPI003AF6BA92